MVVAGANLETPRRAAWSGPDGGLPYVSAASGGPPVGAGLAWPRSLPAWGGGGRRGTSPRLPSVHRRDRDDPVGPFVVASAAARWGRPLSSATGGCANGPPRPCGGIRPDDSGSYSGHTPPLGRFEHPGDLSSPRAPDTTPAPRAVPGLAPVVTGAVTSLAGSDPAVAHRKARAPARPRFPRTSSAISGARRQKRPLTRRCGPFAVRHRLRARSPASPRGPLVVALLAVPGLPEEPRARSARSRRSPGRELPTPARVERAAWARAPRRGFPPLRPARPGLEDSSRAFPRRPPSASCNSAIGSNIGIGPGRGGDRRPRTRVYSDEPPSSRASKSPSTRLYGHRRRGGW
jgi:hypothetical protein